MGSESWIKIVFLQFAVTGGIAAALIVGIWAFNRSRVGYSRWLRLIVSGIAAFGMAPSSVWPNEHPIIASPAALVAFIFLSDQIDWAFALKYGFVPWVITWVLIYEVWKRCGKARLKGEGKLEIGS
ncbi:MAG TPA: hypothetical protein VI282_02885 [Verrucomicrobiae bacterium]